MFVRAVACFTFVLSMVVGTSTASAESAIEFGLAWLEDDDSIRLMKQSRVYETTMRPEKVTIRRPVVETDPETNLRTVRYLDEVVVRQVPATVSRAINKSFRIRLEIGVFRDLEGSKVNAEELQKRLNEPTAVVISRNGGRVPRNMASIFKPSTLVFDWPSFAKPNSVLFDPYAPGGSWVPAPSTPPPPIAPNATSDKRPTLRPYGESTKPASVSTDNKLPPQPAVKLARIDAQDRIALRSFVSETRDVTGYVPSEAEGDNGWRKVKLSQRQIRSTVTLIPPELVAGKAIAGEPFGDGHRAILKSKEIPVVVWPHANPMSPTWEVLFQDEALVLNVPTTEPPEGLVPRPAQSPDIPPAGLLPGPRFQPAESR